MSDPENAKKNPDPKAEEIADAVVVEDEGTPPQDSPSGTLDDPADPETEQTDQQPDASEQAPEPEEAQDTATPDEDDTPAAETAEDPPQEPEPQPEPTPAPERPEPQKQGGFVPLVLGGIVAAGIGFGAATYMGWPNTDNDGALQDLTARVAQQDQAIDSINTRLTDLADAPAPQPDLTPALEAAQAAQSAAEALRSDIAALDTRLSALEKAPAEGGANAAAVEAYEREVRALREAMEQQKAEVAALMDAAKNEKANAEQTAQQAMIRSSVARIQVALDTGKGFADAVADLSEAGVSVPAALVSVGENGVATPAQLAAEYPAAARRALSAARSSEGSGGDVWTFLRNQLGMRSLAPKEGNDADAILSRAEAALAEGRLTDTMAELQTLPEQARVELTDWMAAATQRADALAAAEDLSAQVASN